MGEDERVHLDSLTDRILGAAIHVHTKLGPGLLESTYETCLEYELNKRGFRVERQKILPVRYDNITLDQGYRIDLIVDDKVIVELKSVEAITDVHVAQVLTYLKLSGLKVGLLLNFNVALLKKGMRRLVNGY